MSPRSKQQFEELREASISKILEASLELFGTAGYEQTSIAQIAKKAGISKGLIYNYFDSKDELLRGLIDKLNQSEEKIMEEVMDENPEMLLHNIIRYFFKELRDNSDQLRLIYSLTMQVEKFDFIHNLAVVKLKNYTIMFENLLQENGFPDPKSEAKILAALFDGIPVQYLVLKDDYPLDEMEQIILNKYCPNLNSGK